MLVVCVLLAGCDEKQPQSQKSRPSGTGVITASGEVPNAAITYGASVTNDEERKRFMSAFLADLTPEQVAAANAGCKSENREEWEFLEAGCLTWAALTANQQQAILDAIRNYEAEIRALQASDPAAPGPILLDQVGDVTETEIRLIQYFVQPSLPDLVKVMVHVTRNGNTIMLNADFPRSEIPEWFFEKAVSTRGSAAGSAK